jgi:hypothetical protein
MSLGLGLASISTQIWHLLLTQGLLFGLGASLLYFPILSAAPEYFTSHRGTAMGFILYVYSFLTTPHLLSALLLPFTVN